MLQEKEDVECTYKDRIQGMVRQLQEMGVELKFKMLKRT